MTGVTQKGGCHKYDFTIIGATAPFNLTISYQHVVILDRVDKYQENDNVQDQIISVDIALVSRYL